MGTNEILRIRLLVCDGKQEEREDPAEEKVEE
jgi:hypothetical protein